MKISAISTFVVLSVLAVAASAQTTPAPTTAKPVVATPAPTTAKPVATPAATTAKPVATPAATTAKPAATPAATTTAPAKYDAVKGCWSVSVERDATYCITGPICSGSGAKPAGTMCPKKGDVATERCLSYLSSYVSAGKCVAPVDAECKVIKTGAWGCVLKGSNATSGGTSGTTTPKPSTNGTASGNTTTNSTKTSNGTVTVPTKLSTLSGAEASGASASVGTIGAIAAVAAVACAAIGTVLYKKNQRTTAAASTENDVVDVVTP